MAQQSVSFEISAADSLLVGKIARRVRARSAGFGFKLDVIEVRMDLTAVHANGCPMDFAKLLAASPDTLAQDVFGICRNIDRKTGRLTGQFLPRCALPETAAEQAAA
jgi:hypothetical protein